MQWAPTNDGQSWEVDVRASSSIVGPDAPWGQQVAARSGSALPCLSRGQYTVAWICPLQIELVAALATLDEVHQELPQLEGDNNSYTLGKIAHHNVILAGSAEAGTHAAGQVSNDLRRAFPAVQSWFMVGIGGGVPSTFNDLQLGDVVIGKTVIPYDPKKQFHGSFLRTADRTYAPDRLLKVANKMTSRHDVMQQHNLILPILEDRQHRLLNYGRPSIPDHLFHARYIHARQEDTTLKSYIPGPPPDPCQDCDTSKLIKRTPRKNEEIPKVHIGDIASGDTLLSSSEVREKLGREDLKVACFEMEAAGLHRELPCLVLRGIADYADSHKNDMWQNFAAATAAACARELLMMLPTVPTGSYQG